MSSSDCSDHHYNHLHLLYSGGGDISHCVQLSTSHIGDTAAICQVKVQRPIATWRIWVVGVADDRHNLACHWS